MLAGIALTQLKQVKEPTAETAAHLHPTELALLNAFKEWEPFIDRTPRHKVTWNVVNEGGATLSVTTEPDSVGAVYTDPKDEVQLQDLVGDSVKAFHSSLGKLIDQWETNQNRNSPEETS